MRYTIVNIPVAELPVVAVHDETRLADAVARFENGEVPPPLIVYQRKLYDGIHRLAAARQLGVKELPAADCPTTADACLLRHAIRKAGFQWQATKK